jgi:hypothetical protein
MTPDPGKKKMDGQGPADHFVLPDVQFLHISMDLIEFGPGIGERAIEPFMAHECLNDLLSDEDFAEGIGHF